MEIRKGYKKTEVGLIPEDWEVVQICDLTKQIGDGIHATPKYDDSGDYYFINGNNLTNGQISISQNTKRVSKQEFLLNKRNLDNTTIILSINGTIGNVAFYEGELVLLGKSAAYLNTNNRISRSFLYFILQTNQVKDHFFSNLTGTTIKNLGLGTIRDTPIPLPPTLEEQKAIADALSDADELIEALDKLIVKKEAIKKGAMQELLRPKEDWVRIILDDEIDVNRGGSPRPIQDYITDSPNGVNWIKIGDTNSKSKYITSAKEKIKENGVQNSRQVQVGDFLLSNSMSFGRPYILKIDGCIHDGWLVLQNYQESFDREFLYYTLTSKDVLNQYMSKASGSGVLNLNKQLVKTVELNKPRDVSEQSRIASILKDMDDEIDMLKVKREKAKQIKEGMMQELLTGKTRLV